MRTTLCLIKQTFNLNHQARRLPLGSGVREANESDYDVNFNNLRIAHLTSHVLEVNNYYPYGLLNKSLSWQRTPNNYKYQTKELQTDFNYNVLDFGARHYDPVTARWTTPDPLGQFANTYYAMGGNPVSCVDPTGMASTPYSGGMGPDDLDTKHGGHLNPTGSGGGLAVVGGGGLSSLSPAAVAQLQLQYGTAIVSSVPNNTSNWSANMYVGVSAQTNNYGTTLYQNSNSGQYVATSNSAQISIKDGNAGHYVVTSGAIVAPNNNWEYEGQCSDSYWHTEEDINFYMADYLWFHSEFHGVGESWDDEHDGFDKGQKIVGAIDFSISSTYAMTEAAQKIGYGKTLVKLGGKEIASKIPLASAFISGVEGFQNGFKPSNYADIGINLGTIALDVGLALFEISNPVGWAIGATSFGADLYYEHYYGESWTQHVFNH